MKNGSRKGVATKLLLRMALVTGLCGCSSVGGVVGDADEDYSAHLSRVFTTQRQCMDGWFAVLSEWADATGGVQGTIAETRSRIAADDRSRLSKAIQSVWRMQRKGKKNGWLHRGRLFESATAGLVIEMGMPSECGSILWVQSVLVQEPEFFAEGAREKVLSAAPPGAQHHSDRLSSWLFDGLLIPEPR